jgi:hypothetical protein
MTRPGIEPGGYSATNRVSYGTAYMFGLLNHEEGSSKLLRIDGVLSEYMGVTEDK